MKKINGKAQRKAQSAFESGMITAVMVLLFTIFFIILSARSQTIKKDQDLAVFQDMAERIAGELTIATTAEDGFVRHFSIPEKISDIEYNVTLLSDVLQSNHSEVIVTSLNYTFDLEGVKSISGAVNGTLVKGDNKIEKKSGKICVNMVTCP